MSKKTVCPVVPGGFCAGVRGALEIFEKTREKFQGPVYVLHELVHNRRVGEKMLKNGAIFVDDLSAQKGAEIGKNSLCHKRSFLTNGFAELSAPKDGQLRECFRLA